MLDLPSSNLIPNLAPTVPYMTICTSPKLCGLLNYEWKATLSMASLISQHNSRECALKTRRQLHIEGKQNMERSTCYILTLKTEDLQFSNSQNRVLTIFEYVRKTQFFEHSKNFSRKFSNLYQNHSNSFSNESLEQKYILRPLSIQAYFVCGSLCH